MPETTTQTETPSERVNILLKQLLAKQPKGFATSSMGKFDEFRKWFASELGLKDWRKETYAVGSAGTAHNFGSRWAQNNTISGSHVPMGAAFLSVPPGADEEQLAQTALNTNLKFVDGSKPTSFEAIITFLQPAGTTELKAHTIQTLPGSSVGARLSQLFSTAKVQQVEWKGTVPAPDIKKSEQEAPPVESKFEPNLLTSFGAALDKANYQADAVLIERVVCSLAAKPFLILAGLSGSGKSLLAIAASAWFSASSDQIEVVPVGADWTSTQHLLGYPDALNLEHYVRTPALDLILRALENPTNPYFLILDEMNLSHVERYFSDFLSAMETTQPITLHGSSTERNGVGGRIEYPKNLFVIGTINVDETTYMFSPKVLDRGNVIEFGVSRTAMATYLSGVTRFNPGELMGQGASFGASLIDYRVEDADLKELPPPQGVFVRSAVEALFVAMDRAGLQFGFRTAKEIVRYLVASYKLAKEEWNPIGALDAQIAQRLLPRLSGDVAKLQPALVGLLAFASSIDPKGGEPVDPAKLEVKASELEKLPLEELLGIAGNSVTNLPITSSKIGRMLTRLHVNGFVTAIEA